MAYQIIKQPNDQYALYSSYSDQIIGTNYTREEMVEWFASEAAERARETSNLILDKIERGERAYHQFTLTWEEALAEHAENGGAPIDLDESP